MLHIHYVPFLRDEPIGMVLKKIISVMFPTNVGKRRAIIRPALFRPSQPSPNYTNNPFHPPNRAQQAAPLRVQNRGRHMVCSNQRWADTWVCPYDFRTRPHLFLLKYNSNNSQLTPPRSAQPVSHHQAPGAVALTLVLDRINTDRPYPVCDCAAAAVFAVRDGRCSATGLIDLYRSSRTHCV